ncbi:MAG TPA: glycosyltransferase family 39 protein [Verrucomicrobiae bacterium]|nr:glycosyltransferase family 39 protein [Verrucomicrobiae bacterium]
MGPTTRAVGGAALLALVAGALFFQDLGRYPLLDPDEARHAEVAREMAAWQGLRRFFLPTLDLVPYREKPAGYYWLVALAYGALGVGEAAARAVSALAALVAVLSLYAYALPRWGLAAGLGAGLVAATSAGWFGLARYGNLDMTVTACVTLGVLRGLAWLERPAPRGAPLVPYVAAGLGLLVKGPLAVLLVAGPLALAVLARPARPRVAELGLVRGTLAIVALGALLYVPVGLIDAGYLSAFAATHVRRLGPASPHAGPIYYYLLWLPALLLPWTLFAPGPLRRAARDPARRPLLLWALFVPAVLTLARGKLATYALSALAPLALLVGTELASGPAAKDRWMLRLGGALVALALVAGAGAALFAARGHLALPARSLLALAGLGWAVGLMLALGRERVDLVPATVLGAVLTVYPLAVRGVAPVVAALHSDREAARLIAGAGTPPVVAFGIHDPSLTFYLRAPVIHTDDTKLVRDLFAGDGLAFLLTGRRHFAQVEQLLGAQAHLWLETPRRRLYANRPANGSS